MLVRPYDRSSMLALFDDFSTVVFTAGSRLVDGDAAAIRLLVDAFRHVATAADRSDDGIRVDRATLVDAAHLVAIRSAVRSIDGSDQPSDVAVVVASLYEVEHRSVAEIAAVLGLSRDGVATHLDAARRRFAPLSGESVADSLRRREQWLDDDMRAAARASFAQDGSGADGSGADGSGADRTGAADVGTAMGELIRPARRHVPKGSLIASIAVGALIIALAGRATRTEDDRSTAASATTTTTTTAPQATTPTPTPTPTSTETPKTNTSATTAAQSDAATTANSRVTTGAILDPLPVGYQPVEQVSYDAQAVPGGWLDLWATPDATRLSGRWLAVQLQTLDSYTPLTPDRQPDGSVIPRIPARYEVDADGVSHGFVTVATGQPVLVAGFGFSADDFARLVDGLTVDDRRRPSYAAPTSTLFDAMALTVSRFSNPLEIRQSIYITASGGSVTIRTDPQSANDLLATSLLGAPLELSAKGIDVTTGVVTGRSSVAGSITSSHDSVIPEGTGTASATAQFVQWHQGTNTVTIFGDVALDELVGLTGSIRPAIAPEWNPSSPG